MKKVESMPHTWRNFLAASDWGLFTGSALYIATCVSSNMKRKQ